jgi:hypothetical protein
MGLYFLRFIVFSYRVSKYLWPAYIFVCFVQKLKVLFPYFYRYLFCSSSLLPVFFLFERLIDFYYWSYSNLQIGKGLFSRAFVFKHFIIRFFFLVFRFLFAKFFMFYFVVSFLRRVSANSLERKKTQKKREDVFELFYLFFFKFYTRRPYQTKTKGNDYLIYAHSTILACLFVAMSLTVIFFFNIRMSSIYPWGACMPRDVRYFKYQKSEGITKYIVTFWKNIWRQPIRSYIEFKKVLWELFVDFVFFAIKPLVAIEMWLRKFGA